MRAVKGIHAAFFMVEAIFLALKAMAKKAKSIVTLSLPGEVHSDLVLAEVPESFVLHIVFYLTEDGLGLYGTPRAVFEPLL